jgi:hypothetical protein
MTTHTPGPVMSPETLAAGQAVVGGLAPEVQRDELEPF